MIIPKEPRPGQRLDATWGRDVVKAIRQLRPSGGPGMRVTTGPNGTTYVASGFAKSTGGSYTIGDDTLYPFRLGVGTESISGSTGERYHKVAINPDVVVNGTTYEVLNSVIEDDSYLRGLKLPEAGSGLPWIWLKDKDFEDITEEAASGEQGNTTDVWFHVDHTNQKCVLANTEEKFNVDSSSISFKTEEIIYAGLFSSGDSGSKPIVAGQYLLGTVTETASLPFRVRAEKNGASFSIQIYLPDGCLQASYNWRDVGDFLRPTNETVGDGWYDVGEATSECYVYIHHTSSGYFTVVLTATRRTDTDVGFRAAKVSIVDGNAIIEQYVTHSVVIGEVGATGGGGGGGTIVTVEDTRQIKTNPGIVGMGEEGATGVVNLKAFDAIDTEGVIIHDVETSSDVTLLQYLAGETGIEDTSTTSRLYPQKAYLLGKNLNTQNYPDLIFDEDDERSEEIVGTSDYVARNDHKHEPDDLIINIGTSDDPNFEPVLGNSDAFKVQMEKIGMWGLPDRNITGTTGDPQDHILIGGYVNQDYPTRFERDGTASAGGATGETAETHLALLALDNHVHPLNVVDYGVTGLNPKSYIKAVGSSKDSTTGKTIPSAAEFGTDDHYARTDHIHPLYKLWDNDEQATNMSAGKSVVVPSSVATEANYLNIIRFEPIEGQEAYTVYYRQPVIDKYGRILGLSNEIEVGKVYKYVPL